eukprot:1310669-Alexandrium_andersonii.AAC.1
MAMSATRLRGAAVARHARAPARARHATPTRLRGAGGAQLALIVVRSAAVYTYLGGAATTQCALLAAGTRRGGHLRLR